MKHHSNNNNNNNRNGTIIKTNHPNPDIKNHDLLAVRAYVTGADHVQYQNTDPDCVIIDLTHSNLVQKHIEIRFYKHDTISTLRRIIYRKTGTSDDNQHLQIYDIDQRTILHDLSTAMLNQYDEYKLGYFDLLYHGMRVHCIDCNPYSLSRNGGLEDVTLIPKYKLSDEQYDAKQSGTLRSWARTQNQQQQQGNQNQQPTKPFSYELHRKQHEALMNATRLYKCNLPLPVGYIYDETVGRVIVDPTYVPPDEETNLIEMEKRYGLDSIQHVTINDRCQIQPGKRRGQVVWIGTFQQQQQQQPSDDDNHNNNSSSCSNKNNDDDTDVEEVGTMMNSAVNVTTSPSPAAPIVPSVPQTTPLPPSSSAALGQQQQHEQVLPGGYWVGVQLDEPTGKNDGRIHGIRYFTTLSSYGAFVRGTNIKTGQQYIVRDIMNDSDDDSDSNDSKNNDHNKNHHPDLNDSDDADEI